MYHVYPSEVRATMEAITSLQIVEIFGAEGFLGALDGELSRLPSEHAEEWLELLNRHRAGKELIGCADHILAVTRKRT